MSCVYFFLKNAPPGALSLAIEVRALRCMALSPRAQSGTRVHVRLCSNTWSCVFFFHRGPSVYTLMAGYKAGIVPVSTPRRTCHCHSLQTTSLRVSPLPWPVGNGRLGRSDIPDIRPMPGRSRIRPDADQARGIRRARYSMLLQKRQQPPACRQVCRPPQQGFRYLGEHLWTNAAGHPVWEETVPQCSKVRQFDVVVRGDLAT